MVQTIRYEQQNLAEKSILWLINKYCQQIISISWTSDVLSLKLKLKPKNR